MKSACVILSVACPSLQHISTLSHELQNFQEHLMNYTISWKNQWTQKNFDFLFNFYRRHSSILEEFCEMSYMPTCLHVQYPLRFEDFNKSWISRRIFGKYSNTKLKKKIRPGWRTGRHDDANSRFPQFYESTPPYPPKKKKARNCSYPVVFLSPNNSYHRITLTHI